MTFVRLSDVRPLVSKKAGRAYTGTADTSGNTTTVLADADLKSYPDDFFNRMWLIVTSGTNAGNVRYITDFTQSSGQAIWTAALPNAAQQAITYEIHQYHPDMVLDAINDAIRNLYPSLAREVMLPVGVGGSPLSNPSFDMFDADGTPTGWSAVSAPFTCSRAENGYRSPYSVSMYGGTGNIQYPHTAATNTEVMTGLLGNSITVYAMCRSSVASQCRLRVTNGSGTPSNGSYHTGGGGWEKLSVGSVSISKTANYPTVSLLYDNSTAAAEWDMVWIDGGTTDRIYLPRNVFPNGPARLYAENGDPSDNFSGDLVPIGNWRYGRMEAGGENASYDYISNISTRYNGRVIWAKAVAPLSAPTSHTDTTTYMELTASEARLLVAEAAIVLLDRAKGMAPMAAQDALEKQKISIARERRALEDGFSSPSNSADLPPAWGH